MDRRGVVGSIQNNTKCDEAYRIREHVSASLVPPAVEARFLQGCTIVPFTFHLLHLLKSLHYVPNHLHASLIGICRNGKVFVSENMTSPINLRGEVWLPGSCPFKRCNFFLNSGITGQSCRKLVCRKCTYIYLYTEYI